MIYSTHTSVSFHATLNWINGSVTPSHAHYTIPSSAVATCLDAASSHHLDLWHVIFHLLYGSLPPLITLSHILPFSFLSFSMFLFLQFQSHFVMVITAIHASCLALPRPVWWRPVLFLWSSFKCQTRTIIKLFFMPSMRSPS